MRLNLKDLEETKIYYEKELEDEDLTGGERNSYLKALEIIEGFIEREKEAEKKGIETHKIKQADLIRALEECER